MQLTHGEVFLKRKVWLVQVIFINYLYQYVHPISIEYPDSSMLYQFC